jgi:hypothetical protein
MTKTCKYCKAIYDFKFGNGSTLTLCKKCSHTKYKERSRIKKIQKIGDKCTECGYDKHMSNLSIVGDKVLCNNCKGLLQKRAQLITYDY